MNLRTALLVLQWVLGPLAVAAAAGELGSLRAKARRGEFFAATSSLSEPERTRLETIPIRVLDNTAWTLGSWKLARQMLKFELDAPDESDGARRARLFIRFGMIDTNFDGQAAVFASACAADPGVCDSARLKEAAEHEAKQRFVAPGNRLPLSLIGGHPPIDGAL